MLKWKTRCSGQAYKSGYGAQFGGKYFAWTARHSLAAPRRVMPRRHGRVLFGGSQCQRRRSTATDLARRAGARTGSADSRRVSRQGCEQCRSKSDLNRPMKEILAQLTKYPVTTELALTGTLVVARDIAHAKLKERLDRVKACRNTSRTIRFITPVRQRRRTVCLRDRLVRRRQGAWIPMSICFNRTAAR